LSDRGGHAPAVSVKRILVSVDPGPEAALAIALAAKWALRLHAKLECLHVWTAPEFVASSVRVEGGATLEESGSRAGERWLADLAESVPETKSVLSKLTVLCGDPLREILAASLDADLLVLGGRPHGLLHRLFLGSTTERLLRESTKSILTVPVSHLGQGEVEEGWRLPQRIAVAVDLSAHSAEFLRYAFDLASRLGAQADVHHVVPSLPLMEGAELMVMDGGGSGEPYLDWVTRSATKDLELLLAPHRDTWTGEARVHVGSARSVLTNLAKTGNCDLLVIGNGAQSVETRMAFGSIAERLVRTAECPVLTVRRTVDAG
jgi:nucleotide-binding universal stress UspA family protein